METCITICKIDSQGKFAVWLRQQQGLCINLEGWDGAGDGRGYIYMYIPMADFMLEFDNNKIL